MVKQSIERFFNAVSNQIFKIILYEIFIELYNSEEDISKLL